MSSRVQNKQIKLSVLEEVDIWLACRESQSGFIWPETTVDRSPSPDSTLTVVDYDMKTTSNSPYSNSRLGSTWYTTNEVKCSLTDSVTITWTIHTDVESRRQIMAMRVRMTPTKTKGLIDFFRSWPDNVPTIMMASQERPWKAGYLHFVSLRAAVLVLKSLGLS